MLISDNYSEVSVKCLLLDEAGQLKSDDCFKKHKVICANGNDDNNNNNFVSRG